jgi:hypothetical protein
LIHRINHQLQTPIFPQRLYHAGNLSAQVRFHSNPREQFRLKGRSDTVVIAITPFDERVDCIVADGADNAFALGKGLGSRSRPVHAFLQIGSGHTLCSPKSLPVAFPRSDMFKDMAVSDYLTSGKFAGLGVGSLARLSRGGITENRHVGAVVSPHITPGF